MLHCLHDLPYFTTIKNLVININHEKNSYPFGRSLLIDSLQSVFSPTDRKVRYTNSEYRLYPDSSWTTYHGHEAYSFTPDADTTAYWVVDKSGELKKRYEAALPSNAKPYTAIPAKLKVRIQGPSSEGFAAEYAGVMEVMEIEEVGE